MPDGGGGGIGLPFCMPAPEPPPELSVDNVVLGAWLGVLPALFRNASGGTGGAAPVGDPVAYDAKLTSMYLWLRSDSNSLAFVCDSNTPLLALCGLLVVVLKRPTCVLLVPCACVCAWRQADRATDDHLNAAALNLCGNRTVRVGRGQHAGAK